MINNKIYNKKYIINLNFKFNKYIKISFYKLFYYKY